MSEVCCRRGSLDRKKGRRGRRGGDTEESKEEAGMPVFKLVRKSPMEKASNPTNQLLLALSKTVTDLQAKVENLSSDRTERGLIATLSQSAGLRDSSRMNPRKKT